MPDQLFAVGAGGGGRVPDGGDVGGQSSDLGTLGRGESAGAGGGEPVVLLAQARTLGQRGLPVFLQLAGHQAVFGFGELVLAPGPVRGELGAFQALPPDPVHLGTLGPGPPGRGEGDFQRGRGQRVQQQPGDVLIHARAGQLLALAAAIIALLPGAHIDRVQLAASSPLVADRHLLAAAAAGHQPGQQRRAVTRRAHALGPGPVGLHPLPVLLVLLDADISGQQPGQEDDPVLPRGPHPPGERPPGLAPPRIHPAAAIGVNPSVSRVPEHVLHHDPAWPPPHQLPALKALPHPHPDLDAVVGQETQHPVHRAQPVKQAED